MAERLHPGVYVEEVGGSVRPIEGVSTSTAAFVGEAGRGIPDRPVLCTSMADYERAFGGHLAGAGGNLGLATQAFFQAGGQRAYVVRVLPSSSTTGQSATINARYTGSTWPAIQIFAKGRGAWSKALRIDLEDATHFKGEAFRVVVRMVEAGSSSIVEVFDDVRMDPLHPDYIVDRVNEESQYVEVEDLYGPAIEAAAFAAAPAPDVYPGLKSRVADVNGEYVLYEGAKLVLGLRDPSSGATYSQTVTLPGGTYDAKVVAYTNGVARIKQPDLRALLKARLAAVPAAATEAFRVRKATGPSDYVTIEPNIATRGSLTIDLTAKDDIQDETVTITIGGKATVIVANDAFAAPGALTPASLATVLRARLGPSNPVTIIGSTVVVRTAPALDGATPSVVTAPTADALAVTATAGEAGKLLFESLDGIEITISEVPGRNFPKTLQSLGYPAVARGYEQGNPANPEIRPGNADNVRLEGGTDGSGAVDADDYQGTEEPATGLHALDRVTVNLLALPGHTDAAYISVGLAYADSRNDCFFLADGPGSADGDPVDPDAAKAFIQGLPTRSDNAAMYYPWIQVPDPVGIGRNPSRMVAPSGHVAGVYARTDVRRGVWKAPAGLEATITGATGLHFDVLDRQQDLLNPVGLNCLRQFAGAGIVSWGARTLSSNPEWRYVPVRRTALFLKESLRRGLQWAVFEPNDTELWDRIRLNITGFMLGLYEQGAFQGATPDEAFAVSCDRSTNPQFLVDQGIVTAKVAFAPLKPAEFVVIQVSQKTLVSGT